MCNNSNNHSLTRRSFIKYLTAGTCAAAGSYFMRPASSYLAWGLPGAGDVVVMLHTGGGWSLNVAPVGHGTFRDKMGSVYPQGTAQTTFPIGAGDQFLHPSLVNLYTRYQAGDLLVCNKVRDIDYSRSHEDATNKFYSGLTNPSGGSNNGEVGIGARVACQDRSNALAGISFAGSETWNQGGCNPPLNVGDLDNLGETPFRWNQQDHAWLTRTRDSLITLSNPASNSRENFVRTAVSGVNNTLAIVQNFRNVNTGNNFPNTGLGGTMQDIARVVIGQVPAPQKTSIFLASAGGYDTHTNENAPGSLPARLTELDGALNAFSQAMISNGLWNRVTICVFGEFGRTFANGSDGTDHGASQVALLLGGRVNGGRVANPPPSPAECGGQYVTAYDFAWPALIGRTIEGALGIPRQVIFPEAITSGDNDPGIFRA